MRILIGVFLMLCASSAFAQPAVVASAIAATLLASPAVIAAAGGMVAFFAKSLIVNGFMPAVLPKKDTMSILNVWSTPKLALVCADTLAGETGGARVGQISKFLPLPHLNCVMGMRGSAIFLTQVFVAVSCRPFDTFDELLDALPKDLPQIFKAAVETCRGAFGVVDATPMNHQELVLVGWSHRSQGMTAFQFVQDDPKKGFAQSWIKDQFSAPWDESLAALPEPSNVPRMEQLAHAQLQLIREKAPGFASGGRLMICQIQKGSMIIADRGSFDGLAPYQPPPVRPRVSGVPSGTVIRPFAN